MNNPVRKLKKQNKRGSGQKDEPWLKGESDSKDFQAEGRIRSSGEGNFIVKLKQPAGG